MCKEPERGVFDHVIRAMSERVAGIEELALRAFRLSVAYRGHQTAAASPRRNMG